MTVAVSVGVSGGTFVGVGVVGYGGGDDHGGRGGDDGGRPRDGFYDRGLDDRQRVWVGFKDISGGISWQFNALRRWEPHTDMPSFFPPPLFSFSPVNLGWSRAKR